MRAVILPHTWGPETLVLAEVPDPHPSSGEVVIDVHATALNFADLLQRKGTYGTPASLPGILGIECSGTIHAIGQNVQGWNVGDEVCALVSGGAYAERVAVPATQLLKRPHNVDIIAAAALPEAACTVWSNIIDISGLAAGEVVLVHGGAGGIGTFAIQAGRAMGARVFATAGDGDKMQRCRNLGAERAISYRDEDFVTIVRDETAQHGADVILDNMGAAYLSRNIDALAPDGRIAIIGLQSGRDAEIPLGRMMAKRGSLFTTSLRDRPLAAKARIVEGVRRDLWPHVESGRILPTVDRIFPFAEMAVAHQYMEAGLHVGKIVVSVKENQA
jgi:putative PIG3 family NAD(P)H quinone oxidoreductase